MSWRVIRSTGMFLILSVALVGSALAQVPRSATLATHAVGSLYNAIGTGIATVTSRHTPVMVRVQPFAGPPAWLPSMDTGDTDMGVLTSGDAATSYKGVAVYRRPFKNTRILVVGGSLRLSFYVQKDAPMETVADLKGKRIPTDFPGIPVVRLSTTAVLAGAGLTLNDVVKVPVSDLVAGVQAFLEGRTDAGWHSVGSPAIEETNARKGGVKFVSVITTPEATRRMAEIYPGSYPSTAKAGAATGIIKDTSFLTNDIYLVAASAMSEEAAYTIAKALWDHYQELGAAYPALKEWTRDRMVSGNVFVPYHPGAIKLFKEKGVWTRERDTLQAKLLAE